MKLCGEITVPPKALTIGELRYAALPPKGDGHLRVLPRSAPSPPLHRRLHGSVALLSDSNVACCAALRAGSPAKRPCSPTAYSPSIFVVVVLKS